MMPTDKRIRVMLVDDHDVVRTGTRLLLERDGRFQVVQEADSGAAALEAFASVRPDLVVLDLNLPGISGMEVTRQLLKQDPIARILIFSIHEERLYVAKALEAGASGYLCKSAPAEEMIDAIYRVGCGDFPQQLPEAPRLRGRPRSVDPLALLTAREFEVFQLLAQGADSREIASTLGWSLKTASNYTLTIKEKLGVGSTAELVRLAVSWSTLQQNRP